MEVEVRFCQFGKYWSTRLSDLRKEKLGLRASPTNRLASDRGQILLCYAAGLSFVSPRLTLKGGG